MSAYALLRKSIVPISVTEASARKRAKCGDHDNERTNHHSFASLSGNTTASQYAQLQEFLGEAVQTAYLTAIEQMDRQSAKTLLELSKKLKSEVAASVVEIIHRQTASDKFPATSSRMSRWTRIGPTRPRSHGRQRVQHLL